MLHGVWPYKVFSYQLNSGIENDSIVYAEWGGGGGKRQINIPVILLVTKVNNVSQQNCVI